jgi:hypothetical protein
MTTLDGGDATEERNRASSSSMNDSQDGVAEDRIFDARRYQGPRHFFRVISVHERLGLPRHVGDHR